MDQEPTNSGSVIPRVNVQSVSFSLTDAIRVNLFGELPLYQTHEYENAIKLWLKSTLKHRERDFALKFQHTEQQVLKLFDYTSRLLLGDDLDEQLTQSVQIQEDYFSGVFTTKIGGSEVSGFADTLRRIQNLPFSDDEDFMRDVQIVIDENYVNDYFLNLFHSSEVISLTDTLSGYLPHEGVTGKAA